MNWRLSDKADPAALALADRHYSRQKPGTRQFCRPGANHVLVALDGRAVWVTWAGFAGHAWRGAWESTTFRNEGDVLSSQLVVGKAVAATVDAWGPPPPLGMITMVDVAAVRRKRDPGRCYRRAGFVPVGFTQERGYLVLQLTPERFPPPAPAVHTPTALPLAV